MYNRHVKLYENERFPCPLYMFSVSEPYLLLQSISHNSDHSGLVDFVRITENPDYVETFSVLHFIKKLIGLSNSVRNIQKSG